jgi:biopolymer transport protein ExbD
VKRRRYQRKARPHGEVELNMAAMLDMAFQLLAFFILTFRPSAVESQVSLRMPPAIVVGARSDLNFNPDQKIDEDLNKPQIPLSVHATADGEIARIEIGSRSISGQQPPEQVLAGLHSALHGILKEAPFDGVALQVSPGLLYERLMQVVDVCTKQTLASGEPLTKVSINEISGE